MIELIKITNEAVNARELWDFLGIKHEFRHWIANGIRDYGFTEGEDFRYFFNESTGGRKAKDYAITINMAKELAMVSKTKKGREVRKYFIKCEEIVKKQSIVRLVGKEVRKGLTDKVIESGENERMHNFGISRYTLMSYNLIGLSDRYKKNKDTGINFRDTLDSDELQRVETVEKMMDAFLTMGKQYKEIKHTLESIIPAQKEIV